jgi:hypothetical protein
MNFLLLVHRTVIPGALQIRRQKQLLPAHSNIRQG